MKFGILLTLGRLGKFCEVSLGGGLFLDLVLLLPEFGLFEGESISFL